MTRHVHVLSQDSFVHKPLDHRKLHRVPFNYDLNESFFINYLFMVIHWLKQIIIRLINNVLYAVQFTCRLQLWAYLGSILPSVGTDNFLTDPYKNDSGYG